MITDLAWFVVDIEVSIDVSILVLSISLRTNSFSDIFDLYFTFFFLDFTVFVTMAGSGAAPFYYYDFLAFSAAIDLSFWDTSLQTTAFNLQANDDMNRLLNEPEVF